MRVAFFWHLFDFNQTQIFSFFLTHTLFFVALVLHHLQSQYVNIHTYILSRALNFPKHNNFSQSRGRETRNVDVEVRNIESIEFEKRI